ncbi:hypothetical protein HC248_00330 [Polaromonas vacuolata]|uniref:Uncharacterized protein n=2 Tax=Polaromonas vacuolata TaxID=37448 RepID=A0A6H2H5M3_9BURK|nr:hypothetical protein HC248_00330 [Polaromonas vacuolata]
MKMQMHKTLTPKTSLRLALNAAQGLIVPAQLRLFLQLLLLMAWPLASPCSHAFTIQISAPPSGLYLQVGDGVGQLNLTAINSGSARNSTVNTVSLAVPAARLGLGPLAMTTDSLVSTSPIDGYPNYCSIPAQVYIGGFYRTPNTTGSQASLTISAPTALFNPAGERIPINTISWLTSGLGDVANNPTVPNGTFSTSGSQVLRISPPNVWFESCMQFRYANSQILPPGTYTGQVTYSLTAP